MLHEAGSLVSVIRFLEKPSEVKNSQSDRKLLAGRDKERYAYYTDLLRQSDVFITIKYYVNEADNVIIVYVYN